MRYAFVVFTALLVGGCGFLAADDRHSVALGELIELSEGQTVRIGRSGPLLTFKDVPADSRCPNGVECVWEGEALVTLRLLSQREDTTFGLSIPGLVDTPYEGNVAVSIEGFRFKLLEVRPYPETGDDPTAKSHRAVLRIEED